jgi:hypothetical protein
MIIEKPIADTVENARKIIIKSHDYCDLALSGLTYYLLDIL